MLVSAEKGASDPVLPIDALRRMEGRTFLVRARGFGVDAPSTEARLGASILSQAALRGVRTSVSVKSPDIVYLVQPVSGGRAISLSLHRSSRSAYASRARSRSFKHPVAIDPAMARAMVNMAGILEGETVLDPFCGTGSLLVEAGLVGARIFGHDSDSAMIHGARRNLVRCGLRADLVRADALRTPVKGSGFDGIVTDPPYGRSSPARMEAEDLLRAFPAVAYDLLRKGGKMCFASPSTLDLSDDLASAGLRLEAFVYQRVHGSLGRHLYVATKPRRRKAFV